MPDEKPPSLAARAVQGVLTLLVTGGAFGGLGWLLFLRPHGPHFWWWVVGVAFLGPVLAWIGFWVLLYREAFFPWLFGGHDDRPR